MPKARIPQQSKSQAKHNLALGVVRNLDATNISADKYADGPADAMFNIDMFGKPLTHRSAMNDPSRRASFIIADEEEWTRLLGPTYACMDAIPKNEIPHDRFRDVTYYNP